MKRSFVSCVGILLALPLAVAAAAVGSPLPAPQGGSQVLTLAPELPGGVGGVAVDAMGFVYSADFRDKVFRITPDGQVTVFAAGLYGASGNSIDARGNLLQSNFYGHTVTRIDRHGNQETVVAEGLQGPVGVVEGPDGELYITNCNGNFVARATIGGPVERFAEGDLFACPNGITVGPDGAIYVVNFSDGRMIRINLDGEATEFADIPGGGNGHIAVARGDFYVTAFQSHRVFRVTPEGEVSLFAGTGVPGEDDGAYLEATFTFPNGIAATASGDRLYVNDYLNRVPPTTPIPPAPLSSVRVLPLEALWQRMLTALQSGGVEAMVQAHSEWKAAPATAALFTEVEVNALGYNLLQNGQVEAAIAAFEANVEAYPNSANAYDSLGEAHMTAGHRELAIANYERSLAINPGNANAVQMLARLREQDPGSD